MATDNTVETTKSTDIAAEARHLHACLFHQPLDEIVIARYEEANRRFFTNTSDSSIVAKVIAHRMDAEAVEFALRRRGTGRELARKMLTLCYLVEVRSEYYPEFVNTKSSRVGAWATLIATTARSVWKLLKGEYLVRRHGLV